MPDEQLVDNQNNNEQQQSVPSSPRFSKKVISITAFIIVCGIGAGTALAYYFQSSLSSDQVLSASLTAVQNVKTFSFSMNVTSTIQLSTSSMSLVGDDGGTGQTFIFGNATGVVDINDISNPKESVSLNFAEGTSTTPSVTGDVDFISTGGVYYIKIDNVNAGESSQDSSNPIVAMSSFLIGQWFKIDLAALQKTMSAYNATGTLAQMSSTPSSTMLSSEKLQQLRAVALQYPVVSVDTTLPSQIIEGQDMYHYSLALNKENVKNFLMAAYPIIYNTSSSDEMVSRYTQLLSELTVKDMEIWIGKKDFLPYQFSFDVLDSATGTAETNEVQISEQASDYNQPVTVTAPTDSRDLIQLIDAFFK